MLELCRKAVLERMGVVESAGMYLLKCHWKEASSLMHPLIVFASETCTLHRYILYSSSGCIHVVGNRAVLLIGYVVAVIIQVQLGSGTVNADLRRRCLFYR
jgi:hypothetical protein